MPVRRPILRALQSILQGELMTAKSLAVGVPTLPSMASNTTASVHTKPAIRARLPRPHPSRLPLLRLAQVPREHLSTWPTFWPAPCFRRVTPGCSRRLILKGYCLSSYHRAGLYPTCSSSNLQAEQNGRESTHIVAKMLEEYAAVQETLRWPREDFRLRSPSAQPSRGVCHPSYQQAERHHSWQTSPPDQHSPREFTEDHLKELVTKEWLLRTAHQTLQLGACNDELEDFDF
eukprot:m.457174 g.457174  ORF g.457174 m.457174 type:complete len:232 (+) comp56981_c2_seq13:564-1259(+)